MRKINLLAGAALLFMPLAAFADDMDNIVKNGKVYGDIRYRYEHVDQAGFASDADASTVRAKLGIETGKWQDLQGGLEVLAIGHLDNKFNDGVNGQVAYPTVSDPEMTGLHQAWLSWSGLPQTSIKVGRQNINLDNQRFVGSIPWRQNDQTFDSILLTNDSVKDLELTYGYIWHVNRIFGPENPLGKFNTQAHLVHSDYTVAPWLKVIAYDYLLNIDEVKTLSSQTPGLRLTGNYAITKETKFFYTLEGARQQNYDNNPNNYHAEYYHILPGVAWQAWTAQAGYEVLGGNGTNAFQTPLATLHAFNGWADKFLTTPPSGLEDAYGRLAYKFDGINKWVDNTEAEAIYHNFNAQTGSLNYGDEWDFQLSKTFKRPSDIVPPLLKEWSVSLKYADFRQGDAASTYKNTAKSWLTLDVKF